MVTIRIYLSVGLAGDVSIRRHFLEVGPEDVDPLSQGERDAQRLLQPVLDGSLTPGRAAPRSHTRTKRSYADDSSIYAAERLGSKLRLLDGLRNAFLNVGTFAADGQQSNEFLK